MPDTAEVTLNGQTYPLIADSNLPSGRRGWQRNRRPSQPSDPGQPQVANWRLSGPIGLSREDLETGRLAVDYTENLDTIYDQLLIPVALRVPIDLAALDPTESGPTFLPITLPVTLGGFAIGNVGETGGGIIEDRNALLFARGQALTIVNPANMTATATYEKNFNIRGMIVWFDRAIISYGTLDEVERVTGISPTAGATFEDVSNLYAKAMTIGPDRWWAINADAGNSVDNKIFYALDDLLNFSAPFTVGDQAIPATGIGTYGRTGIAGSEVGAYGFTNLGEPTRVLESLVGNRSTENAKHLRTLWGWHYITTTMGLKATVPGQVENPAGPGTDRRYEGPAGRPTAIWPYKDALFLAEVTPSGDTYIYRGEFDNGQYGGNTSQTGNPAWFPFHYLPATQSDAIGSTGLRTALTLIVGEGTLASYYTLGRMPRDISDPLYRFQTGTLTWYGSTLMRASNMHKNIKYFVALTEDVDDDNTFQIEVSVDNGPYVAVGDPITTSGHKFIRPAMAGIPQTNVNGHTFKPRIVCVNTSTTVPPKMWGTLDMIYDERPDTIADHTFVVLLGQNGRSPETDLNDLYDLFGAHGEAGSPFTFKYPAPENVPTHYGFIVGIGEVQDIEGDGVQSVAVRVHEWTTGDE
jgi:hypothetical protein